MNVLTTIHALNATLTFIPTHDDQVVIEDLSDEYRTRFWIMDRTAEVQKVYDSLLAQSKQGELTLNEDSFTIVKSFTDAAPAILKVDAERSTLRLAKSKGKNAFPAKHLKVDWTSGKLTTSDGKVLSRRAIAEMDSMYIRRVVDVARENSKL